MSSFAGDVLADLIDNLIRDSLRKTWVLEDHLQSRRFE
jgi:hypothetical protein